MKGHTSEKKYILAVDDDSDIVTMIQKALQLNASKYLLLLIQLWH